LPANLEQIAYRRLRQDLLTGRICLGQVISENATAKEIGISRTPVRHAIRQLASEGVVVPVPQVGAVVKVPRPEEVEEVFELRRLLECEAASLAAQRATADDVQSLRQGVRQYVLAVRAMIETMRSGEHAMLDECHAELMRSDMLFHWTIQRIAGNRQIARVVHHAHLQTRTKIADLQPGIQWENVARKLVRVCREHLRISNAVRRHDSDAARAAMSEHIRLGKQSYLQLLNAAVLHGMGGKISPAVRLLLDEQENSVFEELSDMLGEEPVAFASA